MAVSRVIGHNFINYDLNVLTRYGLKPGVPIDDTIYKHAVLAPEEPHSLEYVGSLFTNQEYWKDEGKSGEEGEGVPSEQLWGYCALDCTGTATAYSRLRGVSASQYKLKLQLAELAHRMTQRGLLLDEDERGFHRREQEVKRDRALRDLQIIWGDDFNPGSVQQVARVLFTQLRLPITRRTESGAPSVDINALRDLEAFVEAGEGSLGKLTLDALKDWRQASKLLGTYITGLLVHADGAIHPLWKAGLAETGRWRCSDPNAQNFPRAMRTMVKARPGYTFVKFDAKQLELRIVAYFSRCAHLLKGFESGDPHELNTLALFECDSPEDILDPAKLASARGRFLSHAQEYRDRLRTLAKNFVYSQTYGGDWYTAWLAIRKSFPGIRKEDVQKWCEKWRALTPEIETYGRSLVREIEDKGYLTSALGHQTWRFPGGAELTEIKNRPIQGAAADIINEKILQLDKELCNGRRGLNAYIVTQEHDGIMVEVETAQAKDFQREALQLLEAPVEVNGQRLTFPFDSEISDHWKKPPPRSPPTRPSLNNIPADIRYVPSGTTSVTLDDGTVVPIRTIYSSFDVALRDIYVPRVTQQLELTASAFDFFPTS